MDGKECLLDITDTQGCDEFAALRDLWIRENQGFLVVYSILNRSTFDEIPKLMDEIRKIKEDELDEIAIVLVGNKCDWALGSPRGASRKVEVEEGRHLAAEYTKQGILTSFIET